MQSRPGRIVCICDVSNGSDGGGDDNHHNLLSHKYHCLLHLFIVYQHHAIADPHIFPYIIHLNKEILEVKCEKLMEVLIGMKQF